jgi:site-specific DNA recombinase
MTHTYSKKGNRLYRYYTCVTAHQRGWNTCPTRSIAAPEIEAAVINQVRAITTQPELLLRVISHLEKQSGPAGARAPQGRRMSTCPGNNVASHSLANLADVLRNFDPLWTAMTSHEQQTFMRTLVEQVRYDGSSKEATVIFRSTACHDLCLGQHGERSQAGGR